MKRSRMTYGDVRRSLVPTDIGWRPDLRRVDSERVPIYALGASEEGRMRADEAPALDIREILARPGPSPFLLRRRMELGVLPAAAEFIPSKPVVLQDPAPAAEPSTGARPQQVDWRNRWNIPWLTTIQDQNPCGACWAFGATALVESMVRIEFSMWSKRSEDDVHDGMGAKCATGGDEGDALDWIRDHGITDLANFPWTTQDMLYRAIPKDRPGRIVKIPGKTALGQVEDQKTWVDGVGPLTATIRVWDEFFTYSSGVYRRSPQPGQVRGLHVVLVVGYHDGLNAWLVRNSWGTGWGMNGYGWIGYGEIEIDDWVKYGVTGTDPDPWTRRRMHGGVLLESSHGNAHRNFEVLSQSNGWLVHFSHEAYGSWHEGNVWGPNDAATYPTLIQTTYNRNLESVHLTTDNRLHHWFCDENTGRWCDGGVFGPYDAAGVPGFIQGSCTGDDRQFTVIVRTADGKLNHWIRLPDSPWTWADWGRFGSNIKLSAPVLVANRNNELELVSVRDDGQMQVWWLEKKWIDDIIAPWTEYTWHAGANVRRGH